MTRYVLDTDVVSNLRKPKPNRVLLDWLASKASDGIFIPLVVIFEIQFGIEILRRNSKHTLADQIEAWLDNLLRSRGDYLILPDPEIIRLQARMFCDPKLRGFLSPVPPSPKLKFGADLIIAATAIVYETAIVSFNVADYERINKLYPLPGLFHPGRDEWVVPPIASATGQ